MKQDSDQMTEIVEKNDVTDDYNFARDQYYELASKGSEALDMMMEVAREMEHPRAFEVLSTMLKNNADIVDKMMDLQKKKVDLAKPQEKEKKALTQNNVFVGSTAELQNMLSGQSEVIEHDNDGTD
jgi:hypothetical protein